MSDFGSLNVAPSLQSSWVDSEGKPIKTSATVEVKQVTSDAQFLLDKITALEARVSVLEPKATKPKKAKK